MKPSWLNMGRSLAKYSSLRPKDIILVLIILLLVAWDM